MSEQFNNTTLLSNRKLLTAKKWSSRWLSVPVFQINLSATTYTRLGYYWHWIFEVKVPDSLFIQVKARKREAEQKFCDISRAEVSLACYSSAWYVASEAEVRETTQPSSYLERPYEHNYPFSTRSLIIYSFHVSYLKTNLYLYNQTLSWYV